MSEELKLIKAKDIEEIIDKLIKDYGMSTECLSHLLGVEIDVNKFELPKGFLERHFFMNDVRYCSKG